MTDVLQFTYIHTIYYLVNLFVVILLELCGVYPLYMENADYAIMLI